MQKWLLFLLLLICIEGTLTADVNFSDIDLSPDNRMLFKATTFFPSYGTYNSLFLSALHDKTITQLTFFPEQALLLKNNTLLQITNRFGVFRTDKSFKSISAIDIFPAFSQGYQIEIGKLSPVKSSPDGNYLIYFKPSSSTRGDLILYDVAQSQEWQVSENMELCLEEIPVEWSPDSRYFVYSKNFRIYYFSIEHFLEKRILAENYRNIASGKIANIKWDSRGNLIYINGSIVYKILTTEFFTRALYVDFLKLGTIVGKIPFTFEANTDSFWVSPDGQKILLNKGQQNIFLYLLYSNNFSSKNQIKALPYLYLPFNAIIKRVLWSALDQITILTESIDKGVKSTNVYRLLIPAQGDMKAFTQTQDIDIVDLSLSDSNRMVALLKKNSVEIYDYQNWSKTQTILHNQPLHVLWKSESELIIAGSYYIELYNIATKTKTLIALSQAGVSGFSPDYNTILTKSNNRVYSTGIYEIAWREAASFSVKEASLTSQDYRVYIENIEHGNYKNMVMVRDLKGLNTTTLFPYIEYKYESFPPEEAEIDFDNFNHGSRIRRREVALVFNAIDSVEGLPAILKILSEYNLRCTFFINGEFIRRYPDAVSEIAKSGHEVGSLFYAYFNMIDSRFYIDQEFIKKGLARNEDEYFEATGKELSLFWHAPYYFINSEIIKASQAMNYMYVGRDIDTLDWVTKNERNVGAGLYMPAIKLIERLLNLKKPGSIIPIRIGFQEDKREDYLFYYLDIAINALLKLGYEIVPVSTLVEHAK